MHQISQHPFSPSPLLGSTMSPSAMGGGFQQMMVMSQLMQVMMTVMGSLMGMGGHMSALPSRPHMGGGQGGMASGLGHFLGQGGGGMSNGNSYLGSSSQSPLGGPQATSNSSQSSGVTNPVNLSRAQAEELVRKGGGQVNPGGKPTVLALRSQTSATTTYKDTFIVLKADGTMQPFDGNTRPSRSGKDKAMLKPGAYEMSPRWRDGKFNNDAFVVKSANGSMNVGVGRDSNGDGVYSDQEMNSNTSSSLIRFHRGQGDRTSSSGCINCKDYDGFLKAVGGRDASFNFVLVNQ